MFVRFDYFVALNDMNDENNLDPKIIDILLELTE